MTERDYLLYEMNKEELDKWNELIGDIKSNFRKIIDFTKVPYSVFEDTIERTTKAKEQWCWSKGYIGNDGFYYVEEGDRGAISLIYYGYTYEMARNYIVKTCADRIAYAYVTNDINGFHDKNKGQWHFCRIDDGIEKVDGLSMMKCHLEEQQNWIYDAEYDYRLYWFENLLFMVKRILNEDEYIKTIEYYEGCMNCNAKRKWVFNRDSEKFDLDSRCVL